MGIIERFGVHKSVPEFRSVQDIRTYLSSVHMPKAMQDQVIAKIEKRGKVKLERLCINIDDTQREEDFRRSQQVADIYTRMRQDEADAERRRKADEIGRQVAEQRAAEEEDDVDEDDILQGLLGTERYLGSDGDTAYCLTDDNDVIAYDFERTADGLRVDYGSRRVLRPEEVSSVRKPFEARYYELCKRNDQRRRIKSAAGRS